VLDCKGGGDARVKAGRTWRLLHGAGARRVAIWPDEARLSLWDLPPADLAVLLFQMIESGDGAAAYYADIMQAVLTLAVTAPCGACYIHRGAATFVQVARPKPSPLTLTAGSPGWDGTSGAGPHEVRLPAPRREQNPVAESATDRLDHVTEPGGAP
jgi:hypothetical protein